MRGAIRARLSESKTAIRDVFANPSLRRLQIAGAGSVIGDWSYGVAIAVYSYRVGGAAAVGLYAAIRLLASAVVAPLAATLADRYRRQRVMVSTDLFRAAMMAGATVLVALDAPAVPVWALTMLASISGTAFRPAQAALLPSLARSPEELTAANVGSSTIVSVGSFVGPALGGLLLAATDVEYVFALNGATFLWSAFLVAGVGRGTGGEVRPPRERTHFLREATEGFRAIAGERRVRLIVGLYGAQTLVDGARTVLVVTAALGLLELGESGVGFLNTALGVGGLIGVFATLSLLARGKLATDFGIGLAFWGSGLALVGVWPNAAAALVFLGLVGVGNTVVDVSGFTLLQRAAPDEVLARVFGALESVLLGASMLGALLAPLAIELFGVRAALIAFGGLLPALALVSFGALRRLDALTTASPQVELLSRVPMFAPLSPPLLEHLASSLSLLRVDRGETVLRQGDAGERFYVVASGDLEVTVDGRRTRTLGEGDFFGEIALLRDVPRTATVSAVTAADLYALERDEFLAAVTGHAESAEAADAVVAARLGTPSRAEP